MEIQQLYRLKNITICLMISVIFSLFTQILIVTNESDIYRNAKFSAIDSKMNFTGYDVNDSIFTTITNDPQLLFTNIKSNISAIEINFSKPLDNDIGIQIYFAKEGENLSEENSILFQAKKNKQQVILEIPYANYSTLRVDIGSNIGQKFELANIRICTEKISFFEKIIVKINPLSTLILSVIYFLILFYTKKYKLKIFSDENRILDIIFISFCFIMFMAWAVVQPFDSCPDEGMRYDVIKYIFNYNKLPHGGDPLIRDSSWGISYAFMPYLSGIISAILMKIVSIFTKSQQALILAARMAVVCFGTITVYYVTKISNKCFKGVYKWLFVTLICCLPQFVFLGSYMNNDMLALMSIAMMIYYWLEGHEKNWDIKSNIGLAVGVAICLLAYYNAYTFVLFSIIFFIWSNIYNKVDKVTIFKRFVTVTIIVFILSGWWFIRNGIIYNGDFLGINTSNQYSNMYAREDIKPINRATPLHRGVSISFMLFNMYWLKSTFISFVGLFGYMDIGIYDEMYAFYKVIICVGLIFFIIKLFNLIIKKHDKCIFYICMMLAGIMTILLSIYNSYTADFQPQGRYVMSCLIPLMAFITIGFENMFNFIEKRFKINLKKIIFIICGCCISISIVCFIRIIIPKYMY